MVLQKVFSSQTQRSSTSRPETSENPDISTIRRGCFLLGANMFAKATKTTTTTAQETTTTTITKTVVIIHRKRLYQSLSVVWATIKKGNGVANSHQRLNKWKWGCKLPSLRYTRPSHEKCGLQFIWANGFDHPGVFLLIGVSSCAGQPPQFGVLPLPPYPLPVADPLKRSTNLRRPYWLQSTFVAPSLAKVANSRHHPPTSVDLFTTRKHGEIP